mgnify:CR=1 FL=1
MPTPWVADAIQGVGSYIGTSGCSVSYLEGTTAFSSLVERGDGSP